MALSDCYEIIFKDAESGIKFALKDGNAKAQGLVDSSIYCLTIPSQITYEGKSYVVSSIGDAAFLYSGLGDVKIPNSVTSIGNATFSGCRNLISVEMSNSVSEIGKSAFSGCPMLKNVNLSTNVKSIEDFTFYECDGLENIEIPSGVKSIGKSAFDDCSSLESIKIPSSVESIGENAFEECENLTSIVIPSSVTSMGDDIFIGCNKLTVYCEAKSQPSGWMSDWNSDCRSVVWGYEESKKE